MAPKAVGAPTLIDCDPGIDDAVALLLALALPELDVVGVTSVSGNLPSSKTYENVLRVLGFAGQTDLPVGRGPLNPMVRQLAVDPFSHGPDGLGGRELPIPSWEGEVPYAPDLICELAQAHTGELVLICLGPLTNLALALRRDPDLPRKIRRVVVLGGSFGFGEHSWRNGTGDNPVSEWNVYVDPEAARLVFGAGFDLTAVGLDASTDPAINLNSSQLAQLRTGRDPGRFCADMVDFVLVRGFESYCALIDSVAVAAAARPNLVQTQHVPCVVETSGEATLGMTVVDSRHHHAWDTLPRINVASSLDHAGFHDLLLAHLT